MQTTVKTNWQFYSRCLYLLPALPPAASCWLSVLLFFFNIPSGSVSVSFRFTTGEYFRRFAIIHSTQPFSPPYLTCNYSLVKMKLLAAVLTKNQGFWDAELCNAVNNFVLDWFSLQVLTVTAGSFEMSVNTNRSRRRTIPNKLAASIAVVMTSVHIIICLAFLTHKSSIRQFFQTLYMFGSHILSSEIFKLFLCFYIFQNHLSGINDFLRNSKNLPSLYTYPPNSCYHIGHKVNK